MNLITGLHHITAITADAQQNVDFYTGILGLRMIKKTINFDAPDIYHLYYADEDGQPGTVLTFFAIPGLTRGTKGNGQLTVTSFSIPENTIDYWTQRLNKYKINFAKPQERFGDEVYIYLEDHDGLGIELVANRSDKRKGFTYGHIPLEFSVRGFHGITVSEDIYEKTANFISEQMEYKLVAEKDNRYRFSATGSHPGFVDILYSPGTPEGRSGSGTVHHVAFATLNDKTQLEFREKLLIRGTVKPTPVIDRQYFHSIYFREPGGVLFEVATSDIGFTLDEEKEHLGESLKLPLWEEKNRSEIEKLLPPIGLNIDKFRD